MFSFSASYSGDAPVIQFPGGTSIRGDDRAIHEALSEALGQPVSLAREEAIPHLDAGPIHLITTSSLAWLQLQLPASIIDERRFRPNLVISFKCDKLIEPEWIGRTLKFGDIELMIVHLTERCVMVTSSQREFGADPAILRSIAQDGDVRFGAYATVRVPGRISCGDEIILSGK